MKKIIRLTERQLKYIIDNMSENVESYPIPKFSGYKGWKEDLYKVIQKEANLTRKEIAVNDEELKEYYEKGYSPSHVYHEIWRGDAGNFWALPI